MKWMMTLFLMVVGLWFTNETITHLVIGEKNAYGQTVAIAENWAIFEILWPSIVVLGLFITLPIVAVINQKQATTLTQLKAGYEKQLKEHQELEQKNARHAIQKAKKERDAALQQAINADARAEERLAKQKETLRQEQLALTKSKAAQNKQIKRIYQVNSQLLQENTTLLIRLNKAKERSKNAHNALNRHKKKFPKKLSITKNN